jgi:hypothetical protein
VVGDGEHEMDRRQISIVSGFTCGCSLMLTLAGCTTWSDERQKHYFWLYQKCMVGEHEPYTIHMKRNDNSPLLQRCREEYSHYVGEQPSAEAKTHQAERRAPAGFDISQKETADKGTPKLAITF